MATSKKEDVTATQEQQTQQPTNLELVVLETRKVKAMENFVSYIKGMAGILNKKAYIKNEISNNFIPTRTSIGFSDDDIRNVEVMSKHFKDKPDNIVKTYSTAGGIKKEYK
jgi:hypothetical protein